MEFLMTSSQYALTQIDSEKSKSKSKSSSNTNSQNSSSESSKIKNVLTKDFFLKMIRLENCINSKKESSFSLVDDLINMYTQCVEVYDATQDPIQIYFLEKIQYVLSLENTIKGLLQSSGDTKKEKSQKVEENLNQESDKFYKREANHKLNVAITLKESEKSSSRQVIFPQRQSLKLNQMIEGYSQSAQQKDKLIQDQLYDQQMSLDRRLQNRKSSFMDSRSSSIRNFSELDDSQRDEQYDNVQTETTPRYSIQPEPTKRLKSKSQSESTSVLKFLRNSFMNTKK